MLKGIVQVEFKNIFIILLFMFVLLVPTIHAWSSDYITWNYRQNLTVKHWLNSQTDTDYQVYFNITGNANMSSVFNDLRFTWYNTTDNLEYTIPYWIEENATSSWATVWVKVPTLRASQNESVYMYYNKTGVTTTGNASAVFIRYTGFENGAINNTGSTGFEWAYWNGGALTGTQRGFMETTTVRQGAYSVLINSSTGSHGGLTNRSFNMLAGNRLNIWLNSPEIGSGLQNAYTAFWNDTAQAGNYMFLKSFDQVDCTPSGSQCLNLNGAAWTTTAYTLPISQWRKIIITTNTTGTTIFYGNMSSKLGFQSIQQAVQTLGLSSTTGTFLDDIYQTKYSYPESAVSQGSQEAQDPAGMVNIYNISNITYFFLKNFNYTFSSNGIYSLFQLNATLDGTNIYSNSSYNNNTNVTVMYNFSSGVSGSIGSHNLTVNSNASTLTLIFNISAFNFTSETYSTPIYETTNQNYTINFTVNENWFNNGSNYNSTLWWNGTAYYPQWKSAVNTSNGINVSNTVQITIPLYQINNSNLSHFWHLGDDYPLTSCSQTPCAVNQNLTTLNQSVYFAYFLSAASQFQSLNTMIEGNNFTNWLNATAILQNAYLFANSTYRGINYTLNNTTLYYNFTGIIPSGLVTNGNNETYGIISTLGIRFNGSTRFVTSENDSITIQQIVLTNCAGSSVSTTPTLNFTLKKERDPTGVLVNGTMELYLNVSTNNLNQRNYSFFFQNVTNATICIYPTTANVTLNSLNKYYDYNGTYSSRYYYIQDAPLTSTVTNVEFFLLEQAFSSQATFFLTDQNLDPYTDAIIQVQRLYIYLNNTYKTIAQCKSDNPDGKCPTPLEVYNPLYKYTIIRNGTIVKETTPSAIVCQVYQSFTNCATQGYPIPISISQINPNTYFRIYQNTTYGCTLNATTTVLRCIVSDATGLMTQSQLIVNKTGTLVDTTICNTIDVSSGTTFTCTLGNLSSGSWTYQFTGVFSGDSYLLASGTIGNTQALMDFGLTGLVIAFLVIGTLFFMGVAFGPAVALILSLLGVIAGFFIGFVPVTYPALSGLIVSAGIIIWKMSR